MTRRRVLFVGRTRYELPLRGGLARKWDALSARLDVRVLASGTGSDPRFELFAPRRADGPLYYLALPWRVRRALRAFRPEVVVAESPYEAAGARLALLASRDRPPLVVELHGDWRTSTRLYGSPLRRALAPLGDALSRWSLRGAEGHRAISDFTAGMVRELGREPLGVFPGYSDLDAFLGEPAPLPDARRALFVGVLERYKNVEGLERAWALVRRDLPGAELHLVSSGTQRAVAERLRAGGAVWDERLPPDAVAEAMDRSRVLLLPSRSEGLGRVIIEAFLRGRAVIGSRVGGIPDLVRHDENGLLVEPGDDEGLAAAIVRVLSDDALAARLGAAARVTADRWLFTADEFAERFAQLVERAVSP